MKKLLVRGVVALMVLLLLASVLGCQQQSQPEVAAPSMVIMVESNIVEAGSSFTLSGSNFKPNQKIWVEIEFQGSDWKGAYATNLYPDENGWIHPVIEVPEDAIPGDYQVMIFSGSTIADRKLIAILPIHVQAKAE